MDTRCRVRGSDDSRLGFGELGGIGLEAVPDVLRPRIWRPGLYRFCRVGNPSAEQNNRTADHKENLVCAADVHPFLRDTMGGGGLGFLLFGQLAGLGLMVMWVALLPYLLVAGYVVAGLTVALYRTFYS